MRCSAVRQRKEPRECLPWPLAVLRAVVAAWIVLLARPASMLPLLPRLQKLRDEEGDELRLLAEPSSSSSLLLSLPRVLLVLAGPARLASRLATSGSGTVSTAMCVAPLLKNFSKSKREV
ncbi:hypothetical protein Vretifemale_2376 [Volvox reticuliferus]|nr:hypothetical protein Vretifemale_2376 [Volvox reticuliferus]